MAVSALTRSRKRPMALRAGHSMFCLIKTDVSLFAMLPMRSAPQHQKGFEGTMEEVIGQRLTQTFRTTFGKRDIQLTRDTTANDIKEWDSLMHINLIVAVEKEFQVRFTTLEVMSLNNVGDLADTIARKITKD